MKCADCVRQEIVAKEYVPGLPVRLKTPGREFGATGIVFKVYSSGVAVELPGGATVVVQPSELVMA